MDAASPSSWNIFTGRNRCVFQMINKKIPRAVIVSRRWNLSDVRGPWWERSRRENLYLYLSAPLFREWEYPGTHSAIVYPFSEIQQDKFAGNWPLFLRESLCPAFPVKYSFTDPVVYFFPWGIPIPVMFRLRDQTQRSSTATEKILPMFPI